MYKLLHLVADLHYYNYFLIFFSTFYDISVFCVGVSVCLSVSVCILVCVCVCVRVYVRACTRVFECVCVYPS